MIKNNLPKNEFDEVVLFDAEGQDVGSVGDGFLTSTYPEVLQDAISDTAFADILSRSTDRWIMHFSYWHSQGLLS